MQDDSAQGVPSNRPEEQASKARSLFPDAAPPAAGPRSTLGQGSAPGRKSAFFLRVVLPTVLIIFGIGAGAIFLQNLPSLQEHPRPRTGSAPAVSLTIQFLKAEKAEKLVKVDAAGKPEAKPEPKQQEELLALVPEATGVMRAQWDLKDARYKLEMERGDHGYYDYCFINKSPDMAILGLKKKGCDCSMAKICLLSIPQAEAHYRKEIKNTAWRIPGDAVKKEPVEEPGYKWQDLPESDSAGIEIPPNTGGVVRLSWEARRQEGEAMNVWLGMYIWPKGEGRHEKRVVLDAPAIVVPAVRFVPDVLSMGTIPPTGYVEKTFRFWSATQDNFKIIVPTSRINPCIECEIRPTTPEGRKEVAAQLVEARKVTRIKSAYDVVVKVQRQKGKKQLDMGTIRLDFPLQVSLGGDTPVSVKTPEVWCSVPLDEIEVHAGTYGANSGRIDLHEFECREPQVVEVTLLAEKDVQLKVQEKEPVAIETLLVKDGTQKNKDRWKLKLTLPANTQHGPFPETSGLLLELSRPNGETRRVRMAIIGTGVDFNKR